MYPKGIIITTFNVGKTKTMLVNIPFSTKVNSLSDAELVKKTKEFKYLKCQKAKIRLHAPSSTKLEKI